MKALVYTGIQELIYREEKNPKKISGESIVKVHASGICGSDMHAYHGKDERRKPPLILGHEVSGIIHNGKNKDKTVVLNPLISCGKCNYCKFNHEHLCPDRSMVGMSTPFQREGGLAEYISIPDKNIHIKPKDLATNAKEGLEALVRLFDQQETPYESRPRPDAAPAYSDYEHLARVREWSSPESK